MLFIAFWQVLEVGVFSRLICSVPKFNLAFCTGHRYFKAGLKMHSLKCYFQADQIYTGRGWRYAENHVHFTIVRHHSSLHLTSDISKYQKPLVTPPLQSTIQTTNNQITNNIKALPPPVLHCLKLEYSTLKLLNGTEFISLIRAQNLTPVRKRVVTYICHELHIMH